MGKPQLQAEGGSQNECEGDPSQDENRQKKENLQKGIKTRLKEERGGREHKRKGNQKIKRRGALNPERQGGQGVGERRFVRKHPNQGRVRGETLVTNNVPRLKWGGVVKGGEKQPLAKREV